MDRQTDNTTPTPIAITIGDPAGVGAYATLTALTQHPVAATLFTDADYLCNMARHYGIDMPSCITIHHIPFAAPVTLGRPDPRHAAATLAAINTAHDAVMAGDCRALVTGPVNKALLAAVDSNFRGHTEYLAARVAANTSTVMVLASQRLRMALLTTHLPLRAVADAINTAAIVTALTIIDQYAETVFGITRPRIAVLSLNPHAGDGGLLGDEEQRVIIPAIAAAGVDAHGPFAADGLFAKSPLHAMLPVGYDFCLAMYHDQGLVLAKYVGGAATVNVTLGLPYLRTAPDHGPAYAVATTPSRIDTANTAAAIAFAAGNR